MFKVGVDAHQRWYVVCILDHAGQVYKRFEVRSIEALLTELGKLPGPCEVTFEASCGYGMLYDRLAGLPVVRRVIVAHPGELRLIYRSKRKSDRVDAYKLALLLYLKQVPPAHVPPVEVRDWRALIEFRGRLIQKRVTVKNEFRAILRTHGLTAPFRKVLWAKKNRPWIAQLDLPGTAAIRRDLLMVQLDELDRQIAGVTRQLDVIASRDTRIQLLQTIPGIGPRSAEAFVAYVDDVRRFARSKQIGSYFGLVPCQDQSAAKNRFGHITRDGPATVRKLLAEAAWQAIRLSPEIRSFFERITHGQKQRRKIALVATAHWLARVMFAMLRTGEPARFTKFARPSKPARSPAKPVSAGPEKTAA